jgi:hypothetical protein
MSAAEVAEVLDLTKDLVNGSTGSASNGIYLRQLDPFTDISHP